MIWFYILIFIGSCFLLIRSGTWVVKSLVRIARVLEWSSFLTAFVLMAFATSLPELFVGLTSAFHKIPQLSFGNVIGANILNLTLGIAVVVLVAGGLKVQKGIARRDALFTSFIAFLPILLMLDGQVSRVDGIVLLLALTFYLKRIFGQKQRLVKVFNDKFKKDRTQFKLFLKDVAIFFAGMGLLLLSAEGVVRSAKFFAGAINLPLVVTGIIFVSLGTVLPELTFGVKAIAMGHREMALGNFMGTVVVNSTLILGIVSLISPLKIPNFSPYFVGILFTVIVALAFAAFIRTDLKITKKEALILLGIYVIFIVFQLLIK